MDAPILRGDRCQCGACGQRFNSTSMFDRHRLGRPGRRSCLNACQLEAKGYSRNQAGFWIRAKRPADTGTRRVEPAIPAEEGSTQGSPTRKAA